MIDGPARQHARGTDGDAGSRNCPRNGGAARRPTHPASIIKDTEFIIRVLAARGDMTIVLLEQYFAFARDLADDDAVLNRGKVVAAGVAKDMGRADVRRHLTV